MLGEIWIWPMLAALVHPSSWLSTASHSSWALAPDDLQSGRSGSWNLKRHLGAMSCTQIMHTCRYSIVYVNIILFTWQDECATCTVYTQNWSSAAEREMCILDRCDRLVYLPFLLYEVTIGTIGCWWYPFSNSIFIGVLVLEKKRSSSADRFRQSLPSLLLGRIPWC